MKISTLLELLLVFIIIAFGASKPVSKNERKTIQTQQNFEFRQRQTLPRQNDTTEDEYDEDDDEDDDDGDIFGVGNANDDDNKDNNQNELQSHKKQPVKDEDAIEDEDDEDEKDSEEDVSDSEFLLFGEDLFGFFDDSNINKKNKKNKTSTTGIGLNLESTTLSTVLKIKNNINKPTEETSVGSIGAVQEVVNQLNPDADNINATPQLALQHTAALLELAQGSTIQQEESLTTSHETQNIYDIEHFDTKTPMKIEEDNKIAVANVLKDKKDPPITPVTSPTKKPTQKPDDSFLGLVESLITDDDDEKTEEENDSSENSGEGEEENGIGEDEVIKEEDNSNKKIKKKKTSSVIGSISESLGLLG